MAVCWLLRTHRVLPSMWRREPSYRRRPAAALTDRLELEQVEAGLRASMSWQSIAAVRGAHARRCTRTTPSGSIPRSASPRGASEQVHRGRRRVITSRSTRWKRPHAGPAHGRHRPSVPGTSRQSAGCQPGATQARNHGGDGARGCGDTARRAAGLARHHCSYTEPGQDHLSRDRSSSVGPEPFGGHQGISSGEKRGDAAAGCSGRPSEHRLPAELMGSGCTRHPSRLTPAVGRTPSAGHSSIVL